MNATSTVLAVVNPELKSWRAIERGALLASRLGSSLEVLAVVYDQFVEHDERAQKSLLAHQREIVEAVVGSIEDKPGGTSIAMRWGRPLSDEALKRTEEINAELVVMNTQHHSTLKRTLFTSSDWEMLRHCPVPLVLTKDRDTPEAPKIMAAIDPGEDHGKPESLDRKILETASRLSECTGGELWPVHAFDPARHVGAYVPYPPAVMEPGAVPTTAARTPEEIEEIRTQRSRRFGETLAAAGLDPDTGSVLTGEPAECLVESAESGHADFVVMGAVARGIIGRILIGHTAEKVLDRLPCDLVVVR